MNQILKQYEHQGLCAMRAAAAIVVAGLAVGACATTADYGERQSTGNIYAGADRAYLSNYVRSLPDREISPDVASQVILAEQTPNSDAWLLASYAGVEGARLAHEMFDKTEAEKLDGACEPVIKIMNDENLIDISDYCDVSLAQLMAYNPSLQSPQFVSNGEIIAIPGGGAHLSRGIYRAAAHSQLIQLYSVQPGDTLNKIAYTFGAAPNDIKKVNSTVDWSYLPVGQKLFIPVSARTGVMRSAPPGGAVTNNGDATYYDYSAPYGLSGSIVAPKPYQLKPVPNSLMGSELDGKDDYPAISVSDRYVTSGGTVTLKGRNLPKNSDITILRGPNGNQMSPKETVRTDNDGNFSKEMSIPSKTGPGGVIFEVKTADGEETHLSERVRNRTIEGD